MSLSSYLRFGSGRPVWAGTAIDKLVVGVVPAAYAIATIPLIIWAFITFIVSEIVSITANMYNWAIATIVMFTLFTIFLLYEPLFALTLQIAAPIIQIVIFFLIILANILLVLLRLLIDTWNAFVPVIVLTIVYLVDFIVEFLRILADILTEMDLTSMIYDLLEVCWVFVDIVIDVLNVIFSLAPTILVFTAQIVGVLLLILFESIFFLVPYLEWLIAVLPPVLIPVLDAVIELVKVFASLLAGSMMSQSAFAARSLLSVEGFTSSSSSSRFDDGIVRYFQAMHTSARNQPVESWVHDTHSLADATRKRMHIVVPEVRHVTGNNLVGSRQYKLDALQDQKVHHGRSEFADFDDDDDDYSPTSSAQTGSMFSRRRLSSRFRAPGTPFHHPAVHVPGPVPDLVLRDAETGRFRFNPAAGIIGAVSDHATMTAAVLGPSKKRNFSPSSEHTAFASHTIKRARRGSAIASAASGAAHMTMDVMPSVEDHAYALQSSFTGFAKRYGFDGVMHAVSHYRSLYPTTAHFLATELPDVSEIPFVNILVRAEHDSAPPGLKRHFWHEWHRSSLPVRGFRDDHSLNAALENARSLRKSGALGGVSTSAGTVSTATLPIATVADCYTTDPRNILCIPQIPYSWQIPLVRFELPVELDRDCPGFIDPPNILTDGTRSISHWFNPWVILWNTINWCRTLLGWFVSILFLFDAIAVRFAPLRFLTKLFIYADPRKGGISVQGFLCLLLFSWYPLAFIYFWYTVGILWPPLVRFTSQVYTYLSATFRASDRATSRLGEYLQEPDPAAFPVRFYTRNKVADQYFLQQSPYEANTRGPRPYPIVQQVIQRGVFPDGQQFDVQSASAGIENGDSAPRPSLLLASPEQEHQQRLAVANQQRMDQLSLLVGRDIDQVARLRAAAIIDDEPLHAMRALRTTFEERLFKARKRDKEASRELQHLVDRLEATGLIDGTITRPEHSTRHRVGVFARTAYLHGHWLTPAWLIHMAEAIGFQKGLSGYKERFVAM